MIRREGVDSLTEDELEEATKERGLCLHENLDPPDLRAQLRVRALCAFAAVYCIFRLSAVSVPMHAAYSTHAQEWLEFSSLHPSERLPLLIYQYAFHHTVKTPGLWLSPAEYSHHLNKEIA